MVIYPKKTDEKFLFLIVLSELPFEKDQFEDNLLIPDFYSSMNIIKIINSKYNNNRVILNKDIIKDVIEKEELDIMPSKCLLFVKDFEIKYQPSIDKKFINFIRYNISLSEAILTKKLKFEYHELDMIFNENQYTLNSPCLFRKSLEFCLNKIIKLNKNYSKETEDIIDFSKMKFKIKSINAIFESKLKSYNIIIENSIEKHSKFLMNAYKTIYRSKIETDKFKNVSINNLKNEYNDIYIYIKKNILRGLDVDDYIRVFEYSIKKYLINRKLLDIFGEPYDKEKHSYKSYDKSINLDNLFRQIFDYED